MKQHARLVCIFLLLNLVSFVKNQAKINILNATNDVILEEVYDYYKDELLNKGIVENVTIGYDDMKYYLFTQEKCNQFVEINAFNATQLTDKNATIVVLLHGWSQNRNTQWYEDLKNAFCKRNESYYIIEVDWAACSDNNYITSVHCYKTAGGFIGEFLIKLHKKQFLSLENFLIIGHSLGGQLAGAIGQKVIDLSGKKLPRIIALDPAGTDFESTPSDQRLSKEDAAVVSVIHTNGGAFGYLKSCGTIDFYPNGGSWQPGCIDLIYTDVWCSHHRSYVFFIEYILNIGKYLATKCECLGQPPEKCPSKIVSMGDLHSTEIGDYCLVTRSKSPYSNN